MRRIRDELRFCHESMLACQQSPGVSLDVQQALRQELYERSLDARCVQDGR
jgi:hypothetical protein